MEEKAQIVLGLGISGLASIRYLVKQGYRVCVMDSRLDPPNLAQARAEFPNLEYCLGGFDTSKLAQAERLILSPGLPRSEPAFLSATYQGLPLIGDIELFALAQKKAPVIAITGSNGKSTVTSLVGEFLKAAGLRVGVGGNLGKPALDLLDDQIEVYVLELSSFQLESVFSLAPLSATILNISDDHLDRYKTVAAYAKAKQTIYHHAQLGIYCRQDKLTYPENLPPDLISFGSDAPPRDCDYGLKAGWICRGEEALIQISDLRLVGKHNILNAMAALALVSPLNIDLAPCIEVLKTYPGLPHRCQWVREMNGVNWYNDSKATNVGSCIAAVEGLGESFSKPVILLAGGIGKEADFRVLRDSIAHYVKSVYLYGQDAALIGEALSGTTTLVYCDDLKQAVEKAHKTALPGDLVLLAPACASYDMFENYEHRGDVFTALVKDLK